MVPLFSGNGYTIEQKILALRDTFGIKDRGGNQLAYVKKQLVSFGPKFFSVRDSYNVEILNSAMDPYLVLSYAISLDNTEKREKH